MENDQTKFVCLDNELRIAYKLIEFGLGELQCINMANEFYHLPLQLLSSGLERLMKCYICLVYNEKQGKYPTHEEMRKKYGHDLTKLKNEIYEKYFNTNNIPILRYDIDFIKNSSLLDEIMHILSEFGKYARYYNLDIITGNKKADFNCDSEWEKIEIEILKSFGGFNHKELIEKGEEYYQKINAEIVKNIEKLVGAISRQFTLGRHGTILLQLSIADPGFCLLLDEDLGKQDYRISTKILKEKKDKWHKRNESEILNGKYPAKKIKKETFNQEWPFRADEVIIESREKTFLIVNINGYDFSLNGSAKSRYGYPFPHDMGLAILGKTLTPFFNIAFELADEE